MDDKLLSLFFDLMVDKLKETISPEDELLFDEIISSNPDAAADYAEQFDMYHSPAFRKPLTEKVKRQETPKGIAFVKSTKRLRKFEIMKAAAALILIISGIFCFYYSLSTFNGKNAIMASYFGSRQDTAIRTLVTARGREDSVSLPDGSTIRINADTRVDVQYSKNERKVNFKGEAYFKVASNRRPFIVTTPYGIIEVLGTEFNVNTYDSGVTKITLLKGKIRYKALNKSVIVQAGEQLVYSSGSFRIGKYTDNVATAWQQGVYSLNGEKLKAVVPKLQRVFDTCIVIDDKQLEDSTVFGWINKSSGLIATVENLREAVKFNYHFSGDTLHLTTK